MLRRHEAEGAAHVPAIRENYEVAHEIDVTQRLRGILATGRYYGTGYLAMDCHFIVFRRTSPPREGDP